MSDETIETNPAAPVKKLRRLRRTQQGSVPSGSAAPGAAQGAAAPASKEESTPLLAGQLDLLIGMAGKTSRIVNRAVSVLEEELAAGISATQNIEQKLVDVDKLRSGDPQEVIQRFRKDAHDVVDILIDLVNVATNALGGLGERALSIGLSQPAKADEKKAGVAIPSLAVPGMVKPGEAIEIPMTLENESDKPTEAFFFHSSDLVNTSGERIPAQSISFSPERLQIEPQKATTVTVTVRVPVNTLPGVYSGLLQATRMDQLRAVLSIQIG